MRKLIALLVGFALLGARGMQAQAAGSVTQQRQELVRYLKAHRQSPEDYVVSKFTDHDIVFLGEEHYIKDNLEFVQRLIPRLYRAGVYNLGIEFGAQEYQNRVDALVTGDKYDENMAREIMFKWFVIWGYKDYEDIYRAAWALNHSLPKGARKFRVVNLNYRPNWSALKGARTREVMDKVWFKGDPDEYMAQVVLQQFVAKGEKALIYAGAHHAFTHYNQPYYDFQKKELKQFTTSRMGNVVYRAIPERVFNICLHYPWATRKGFDDVDYPLGGVIDEVMHEIGDAPVGFDVRDSPLGKLRDVTSYYSIGYPDFTLATFTDGYVYLKSIGKLQGVTVDEKFITRDNLQEAIETLWDTELRKQIQRPGDLLDYMRKDADLKIKYAKFR